MLSPPNGISFQPENGSRDYGLIFRLHYSYTWLAMYSGIIQVKFHKYFYQHLTEAPLMKHRVRHSKTWVLPSFSSTWVLYIF